MLNRVQVGDAGKFVCTVRNAAGEASKSFAVDVDGML
jgi:hypothetical protein